jgi:hypothetical protein
VKDGARFHVPLFGKPERRGQASAYFFFARFLPAFFLPFFFAFLAIANLLSSSGLGQLLATLP